MDCPLKVMIELLLSNVVSVLVRGWGDDKKYQAALEYRRQGGS